MQIGELISRARGAKGLDQKELADLVGVHHKTISKWERGLAHPRGKMAVLEDVLGVRLVNRAPAARQDAKPADLSNPQLVARVMGDLAELTRRLPPEVDVIDAETVLRNGWSATRRSDLAAEDSDRETGAAGK